MNVTLLACVSMEYAVTQKVITSIIYLTGCIEGRCVSCACCLLRNPIYISIFKKKISKLENVGTNNWPIITNIINNN